MALLSDNNTVLQLQFTVPLKLDTLAKMLLFTSMTLCWLVLLNFWNKVNIPADTLPHLLDMVPQTQHTVPPLGPLESSWDAQNVPNALLNSTFLKPALVDILLEDIPLVDTLLVDTTKPICSAIRFQLQSAKIRIRKLLPGGIIDLFSNSFGPNAVLSYI